MIDDSAGKKMLRFLLKNFVEPEMVNSHQAISGAAIADLRDKTKTPHCKVDLTQPLLGTRFVVFDTETTGLYPFGGDEITSIGAVVIEDGEIRHDSTYNQLVNPHRPIPKLATSITGITQEMVAGQPNVFEALSSFLDFARNSCLVAHNSDFDLNFINLKLRKFCKTKIQHNTLDTLVMGMALYPSSSNHTLDYMCAKHSVVIEDRHTALGDALVTAKLFLEYLHLLRKRGVNTLKDLYSFLHWKSFI